MIKRIICLEGPDRVGKSTQLKLLLKYLLDEPTYVIHFSGISGITSEQSRQYSYKMYIDTFNMLNILNEDSLYRNIIFDRCWIGEYVYSPLYRNYSGEYIFDIEKKFEHTGILEKITLFTLVDEPESLIKREDGHSFSIELENKKREIELFKEAHKKSIIKRKFFMNIHDLRIEDVHRLIKEILFPKWL